MRNSLLAVFASLLVVGCSHSPTSPVVPASGPSTLLRHGQDDNKIQHVVFIVQENRTFDNIFGGPNPFPGADAVSFGQTSSGKQLALNEVNLEKPVFSGGDPNNYHFQWMTACNAPSPPPWQVGQPSPCRMNGFDQNAIQQKGYPKPVGVGTIYSYVNRSEVAPYWFIAKHYALGDHFFMGHNSESYTAHQYIFSSQSHGTVDAPVFPSKKISCGLLHDFCVYTPWGCDSPAGTMTYSLNSMTGAYTAPPAQPAGPAPCFGQHGGYPSIADLALAKNVSWKLYAYSMCSSIVGLDANYTIRHAKPSIWPDASKMADCYSDYGLYSPLLANSTHFRAQQYTFVGDESGGIPLSSITWILPGPYTSDHPGIPFGDCGPTWVAQAINAIGASPDWKSTAIFVFWDDWGGFYDHVAPYVVRDQVGPGFRVPLLVISPYVNSGQVVHTNVEFATLNKFVEQTFNLGSLGATDASPYLNNLNGFFNFNQAPQKFTKIPFPSYLRCNYLPGKADIPASVRGASRWVREIAPRDDGD